MEAETEGGGTLALFKSTLKQYVSKERELVTLKKNE